MEARLSSQMSNPIVLNLEKIFAFHQILLSWLEI